jgi:ABC-type transport system substrate-binding protein
VRSIDPTTCGDTASTGIQTNIYEGLYCYHFLIRPSLIVPQLATEMPEISEDRLTYTIRIKPGVKYHRNPCFGVDKSGLAKTRTVRAEDFVLAFKRIADYYNTKTSLSWSFLSGRIVGIDEFRNKTRASTAGDFSRYNTPVAGLKALDEHTLQIKLTKQFPQLIYVLAMHVYAPCPREAIDYWLASREDPETHNRVAIPEGERSVEFRAQEMVIGTGPYILRTFSRKRKIVLVRNPDFREQYYPTAAEIRRLVKDQASAEKQLATLEELGLLKDAGKRVPFVDAFQLDFVAETYAAWMRFLLRQTDASGVPRETFESVITPGKDLTESWKKKHIRLVKYASPAVYWYAFNMDDPVVGGSKSLRQAMCLCYDEENVIKVLRNGRGMRAVNTIPSTFKGWKEAGPGPYYKLDLAEAKKKIAQAKKELAAKGLLDAKGEIPEIKLDFPARDVERQQLAEFAKLQFAKIGLRIKPSLNDWPTLQEKVHNKNVQVYAMGWHADYPDAENFLQLYYSPNIKKGTNNTNYSDGQFDAWYRQASVMPDCPERTELYVKMIRKISEDTPVMMLSEPMGFVLFYDWYQNTFPHPIGGGFRKYVRIDEKMRKRLGGK